MEHSAGCSQPRLQGTLSELTMNPSLDSLENQEPLGNAGAAQQRHQEKIPLQGRSGHQGWDGAGSCLTCAREEHRQLLPPPPLCILSAPKKTFQILFAFSDSDLLNYCKWGPESGTASHVHTQPQTPQEGIKAAPAPPEHLLCSELLDSTLSAWVNDGGAG